MRFAIIAVACVWILRPTPVGATPITWEAIGSIMWSPDHMDDVFPVGSLVIWQVTYDSDTPPEPFPAGRYRPSPAQFLFSTTIAGYEFTGNGADRNGATHLQVLPEGEFFVDQTLGGGGLTGDPAAGIWFPFAMDLSFSWNAPFGDTALPTTLPESGGFSAYFSQRPGFMGPIGVLRGEFTEFRAVPEPSSLSLIAAGTAALALRRRRRL